MNIFNELSAIETAADLLGTVPWNVAELRDAMALYNQLCLGQTPFDLRKLPLSKNKAIELGIHEIIMDPRVPQTQLLIQLYNSGRRDALMRWYRLMQIENVFIGHGLVLLENGVTDGADRCSTGLLIALAASDYQSDDGFDPYSLIGYALDQPRENISLDENFAILSEWNTDSWEYA